MFTSTIRDGFDFGRSSAARYFLVVDPEKDTIGLHSQRPGDFDRAPSRVRDGRALMFELPRQPVASDVFSLVQDPELDMALDACCAGYRGSWWDGKRHKGRWVIGTEQEVQRVHQLLLRKVRSRKRSRPSLPQPKTNQEADPTTEDSMWNYTGMCELCGGATEDFVCRRCKCKVEAVGSKYTRREFVATW